MDALRQHCSVSSGLLLPLSSAQGGCQQTRKKWHWRSIDLSKDCKHVSHMQNGLLSWKSDCVFLCVGSNWATPFRNREICGSWAAGLTFGGQEALLGILRASRHGLRVHGLPFRFLCRGLATVQKQSAGEGNEGCPQEGLQRDCSKLLFL